MNNDIPNINATAQVQIDRIAEKCARIKPLVAISCITYNHEKYLRDALEGFLMQKTDFPFVAIVHDDASTDGTATILREYAEKYPDIILPIYEKENQYSKRNGSLSQIMHEARNATGAKFIAYCEGDDYWTESSKLQLQVDFLESNNDYSMCFHNAIEHWVNRHLEDSPKNNFVDRDFTGVEIYECIREFNKYIVPTASILVRRSVLNNPKLLKARNSGKFYFGDLLICLSASDIGKIRYIAKSLCIYNRHYNSATFTNILDPIILPKCHRYLPKFFGLKYFIPVRNRIIPEYQSLTLTNLKNKYYREAFKSFFLAFKFSPLFTIYSYIRYIVGK